MLPFPSSQCHQCRNTKYISAKNQTVYLMCTGREQKYYPQPQWNCPSYHPLPLCYLDSNQKKVSFQWSYPLIFEDFPLWSIVSATPFYSVETSQLPLELLSLNCLSSSENTLFFKHTLSSPCLFKTPSIKPIKSHLPFLPEKTLSIWSPHWINSSEIWITYTLYARPPISQEIPLGRLIHSSLSNPAWIKISER